MSKLVGGGLHNCTIVQGMVLKGDAVGSIKRMEKAKVQISLTKVLQKLLDNCPLAKLKVLLLSDLYCCVHFVLGGCVCQWC